MADVPLTILTASTAHSRIERIVPALLRQTSHVDGEDVDFCLRVRELGYGVLYCASSVLLQHESATAGRRSREDANFSLFLERWRGRFPDSGEARPDG